MFANITYKRASLSSKMCKMPPPHPPHLWDTAPPLVALKQNPVNRVWSRCCIPKPRYENGNERYKYSRPGVWCTPTLRLFFSTMISHTTPISIDATQTNDLHDERRL